MKGIQVCLNEGPSHFPRGDNYEIGKINFKIFFSRTTGPISTKFGTKHLLVKGIQVCSNEAAFNSQKVDNGVFLSLNHHYDIIMCELFSQASDVAHGPLVIFNWHNVFIFLCKGNSHLLG